jgi:hypothetical protein
MEVDISEQVQIMKYLKRFIESATEVREFDEHTDADIRQLFTDYTDENPDSLVIKNVFVHDGSVVPETAYMKDASKYRKAKMVTLSLGKVDGISLPGMERCMTSFDKLREVLREIERFYDLSEEKEINFNIGMDWKGLIVTFIIMGGFAKQEESLAEKIDGYLNRIKEALNSMGHRRVTVKGNWLDARFAKKNDYSFGISNKLHKIGRGEITLANADRDYYIKMVEVRNEAWEDGLKFEIGGGDQQVVLKLVKR